MKKYTEAQMKMIANHKLNGADVKVVFMESDSLAHIIAEKAGKRILLFKQTFAQHFAVGGR